MFSRAITKWTLVGLYSTNPVKQVDPKRTSCGFYYLDKGCCYKAFSLHIFYFWTVVYKVRWRKEIIIKPFSRIFTIVSGGWKWKVLARAIIKCILTLLNKPYHKIPWRVPLPPSRSPCVLSFRAFSSSIVDLLQLAMSKFRPQYIVPYSLKIITP